MSLTLAVEVKRFRLHEPFTISRGTRTHAEVVEVRLGADGVVARGEGVPSFRYDESLESVVAEIEAMRGALEGGLDRAALQDAMPAGAARNALDCAFWDLEAKRAGKRVWDLAGLAAPRPVETVYTLSLETPDEMRAKAALQASRPVLKVKLGGEGDIDRLRAVREGAPEARIVIDANEGWDVETYRAIAPELAGLGVEMVEQPLPAGSDAPLEGIDRPLPICADEACHTRASLPGLKGKYDMVNIKLDKTGGLTEALALKAAAEAEGYKVMVGCMIGTSLSMAPAHLVAQGAAVADLDPPLLLAEDREPALRYEGSLAHPAAPELWG